jgi:hypothetical protein
VKNQVARISYFPHRFCDFMRLLIRRADMRLQLVLSRYSSSRSANFCVN